MQRLKQLIIKFLNLEFFVSPIDQFLHEYDRQHPKLSASQCKEIAKYKRIYQLRDHPTELPTTSSFWNHF